jgi:hypothetical protein
MYCTSCGTENTDTARFCRKCGRLLQQKAGASWPISNAAGKPDNAGYEAAGQTLARESRFYLARGRLNPTGDKFEPGTTINVKEPNTVSYTGNQCPLAPREAPIQQSENEKSPERAREKPKRPELKPLKTDESEKINAVEEPIKKPIAPDTPEPAVMPSEAEKETAPEEDTPDEYAGGGTDAVNVLKTARPSLFRRIISLIAGLIMTIQGKLASICKPRIRRNGPRTVEQGVNGEEQAGQEESTAEKAKMISENVKAKIDAENTEAAEDLPAIPKSDAKISVQIGVNDVTEDSTDGNIGPIDLAALEKALDAKSDDDSLADPADRIFGCTLDCDDPNSWGEGYENLEKSHSLDVNKKQVLITAVTIIAAIAVIVWVLKCLYV